MTGSQVCWWVSHKLTGTTSPCQFKMLDSSTIMFLNILELPSLISFSSCGGITQIGESSHVTCLIERVDCDVQRQRPGRRGYYPN